MIHYNSLQKFEPTLTKGSQEKSFTPDLNYGCTHGKARSSIRQITHAKTHLNNKINLSKQGRQQKQLP